MSRLMTERSRIDKKLVALLFTAAMCVAVLSVFMGAKVVKAAELNAEAAVTTEVIEQKTEASTEIGQETPVQSAQPDDGSAAGVFFLLAGGLVIIIAVVAVVASVSSVVGAVAAEDVEE